MATACVCWCGPIMKSRRRHSEEKGWETGLTGKCEFRWNEEKFKRFRCRRRQLKNSHFWALDPNISESIPPSSTPPTNPKNQVWVPAKRFASLLNEWVLWFFLCVYFSFCHLIDLMHKNRIYMDALTAILALWMKFLFVYSIRCRLYFSIRLFQSNRSLVARHLIFHMNKCALKIAKQF